MLCTLRSVSGLAALALIALVQEEKPQTHWAFQPLKHFEPIAIQSETGAKTALAWRRTPVDQFIAAKLEQKGLVPNPIAERRTLIRRAYFDLIGLPHRPKKSKRSSRTRTLTRTRS